MKQGWEIKKLGEIGTFQRGGGFLKSDYVEDGFPCIHYGQIHTRFGVKTLNHLTCIPEQLALSKSKIAHKGDIVMAITSEDVEGSCKCTAWMGDYDVAVGGHAAIFRHILNPAFVAYYFRGAYFQTAKTVFAHGSKVVEIKPNDIATIKIAYPSMSEQEKIVSELDCLSGIIEKKRQQLKELDALAQSIFYEMFGNPVDNERGWEVKALKDIADFYNGVAHEGAVSEDGKYDIVNSKFISTQGEVRKHCEQQMFPLIKNDIVMVMSDVPNGKALAKCYLIETDDKYTLNQRICAFRNYNLVPIYLYYYLNRHPYYLDFDNGNGQTNLRKNEVLNCPIFLPPLPLQQTFAQKIEAIEQQKALIKQSIAEVETLFNARMQEYFE